MVRGCSAAVGNFTEVIHQPRRGRGTSSRRVRLELVPLPLIPFGYTKTTKGETKCEET